MTATDKETEKTPESKPAPELPRLAFTLNEFAQMMGMSYITAYRLVQRGKLKTCGHLRTKLISKSEVDRFLGAA